MKPSVQIFKDIDKLNRSAAEIFVSLAAQAIAERGQFLVALSGGGTPQRVYGLLAEEPFRERVDWPHVHVFWGDERCVPAEHPESNYGQARAALLMHVPIPTENIHRVLTELGPDAATIDCIRVLKDFASPPLEWPRFDLVLLGLGADGHTASLFPGSRVDESAPVIAVSANYQNRPAERITLTPSVFNSARQVMFLVAGGDKASALAAVLGDDDLPAQYPAQRIRPSEGQVTWLVDEAAASALTPLSIKGEGEIEGDK